MKLFIYEEFDPKFAMQNIKEAMLELKRMVERELKNRSVSVRVDRQGATGYSIIVNPLDSYVSKYARGSFFPMLNVRTRKQRNGEVVYNLYPCSTGTLSSDPYTYNTWEECRDALLSSGFNLLVRETNNAYNAHDKFKRDCPDDYNRAVDLYWREY